MLKSQNEVWSLARHWLPTVGHADSWPGLLQSMGVEEGTFLPCFNPNVSQRSSRTVVVDPLQPH